MKSGVRDGTNPRTERNTSTVQQRAAGQRGGDTAGVQVTTHSTEHPGVVHTAAVNMDEAFLSWNLQSTVGRELIISKQNNTMPGCERVYVKKHYKVRS